MAEFCFTPRQTGVPRRLASAFGAVPELITQGDYCRSKGGCSIFLRPSPTMPTDFFDGITGFHACDHMAAFLKLRNPYVDEGAIAGWCSMPKADPDDRSLVPDIITHQPERTEFYEIKPGSDEGRAAGRRKIANFGSLCAGHGMPYQAGVQYTPNIRLLVFDGTWLTVPAKGYLRIEFDEPGLIVYRICVESSAELLTEAAAKLLIKMIVAALILLATRAPALVGGAVAAGVLLITLTNSPLRASVGADGEQDPADTRYVRALLDEWRSAADLPAIGVDGEVSQETLEAIAAFQQEEFGAVTGVIEPGDDSIRTLERQHLTRLLAAAVADDALLTADGGGFDDRAAVLVDIDEDGSVLDLPAELATAVGDYLDTLYSALGDLTIT